MRKALQNNVKRVREDILEGRIALSTFSRPLDTHAVVITTDNQLVLAYRGGGVYYPQKTWSHPGEQMDADQDFDERTRSVNPTKTVMRVLTETDELHLPRDVAGLAHITFIALATEWDALVADLVAVVNLRRITSAMVRDYFPKGEHDFVDFVSFQPEPCLELIRDDFSKIIPGTSGMTAKLNDISRFATLAALFNRFGDDYMRKKIKSLSESC